VIDLIQEKLKSYKPASAIEEENATKEILQEVALYALWRAKFFDIALFQCGTSLRILHGLPRFSEDLDFMLAKPDPAFEWAPYLNSLLETFQEFGIASEAVTRGDMEKRIRQAVIKDTSVANQLDLSFADRHPDKKIKIKLEIVVAPPAHSGEAFTFLDFPLDHEVRHQDLASNFALKIHALLCRSFVKGRDWYDFSWYVTKSVYPNLKHLEAALFQFGPWAEKKSLAIDSAWLRTALESKIASINWQDAAHDVERFLRPREAASLSLWSEKFFMSKLGTLLSQKK